MDAASELEILFPGDHGAQLHNVGGEMLQLLVVIRAQGEPYLSMSRRHTECLLAQYSMRHRHHRERFFVLQHGCFLAEDVNQRRQNMLRTVTRLRLRGMCRDTVKNEFQAKRTCCETAFS